ncbi:MAG: alpha-ketoacid dehydrogenase subunit beta [Chloroflexi bacterium]|nr:alpha-ketoacid dehydrogenase subunit beta [Ardenticatenaceae bacterium]MBL1130500.1 alpha-ketoacid dehydrogenase subunit beta [Chloroflexota bacterium]NOG36590.1 alpha-ketoacid dehydrogenase subunit beta [Chloroflexota bacterium]
MARLTLREAITEALREEMQRDENVFIMGEEVGAWGGTYAVTKGFLEEFGERRVRDTPISEMVIAGAAVGAAMAGTRPVAEFMTINFAFVAFDAIVNHAAKVSYMFNGQFDCPVVFRAPGGGGKQLGATHSHTPDVIFAHFPGLKVVCPATPYDAKGLLKAAIRDNGPVLFIEPVPLYTSPKVRGDVPDEDYIVPIGEADIKRVGKDVTIITYGEGLHVSLDAAETLAKEGVQAEVVDLRTLQPLDMSLALASFKKTFKAVVVEFGHQTYGIGAEVVAQLQEQAFDYLDAPIKRVAQYDVPAPYSGELEKSALPDAKKVVTAVKEIL